MKYKKMIKIDLNGLTLIPIKSDKHGYTTLILINSKEIKRFQSVPKYVKDLDGVSVKLSIWQSASDASSKIHSMLEKQTLCFCEYPVSDYVTRSYAYPVPDKVWKHMKSKLKHDVKTMLYEILDSTGLPNANVPTKQHVEAMKQNGLYFDIYAVKAKTDALADSSKDFVKLYTETRAKHKQYKGKKKRP